MLLSSHGLSVAFLSCEKSTLRLACTRPLCEGLAGVVTSQETSQPEPHQHNTRNNPDMSPIYTSSVLRNNAVQAPVFMQKELEGQNTGRLEDIHMVGIPQEMQPHYPQYIANLPAFLTATAIQRKVTCGNTYFFTMDPKLLIPLSLPPLTIAPIKPFGKEEDEAAFLQKLPGVVTPTVYLRRKTYVVSSLTAEQVAKLPPIDPNVPASSDSTSLIGMRQYLTTLKILSTFLATHTYPAFATEADDGQMTPSDIDLHQEAAYKPSVGHRGLKQFYPSRYTGFKTKEIAGPTQYNSYPDPSQTASLRGTVVVAKPAPLYPTIGYGPPSALPSYPGFILPYFHGLTYPAEGVLITVMRRFFLACFGEKAEDRESKWSTWVKGVSKWHRTEAGMAITHIFFCLQTALECQGRLFVILSNGKYLGSAILGYKFSIAYNGMLLSAQKHDELQTTCADLDEHSSAVKRITDILKGCVISGSEDIDPDLKIDISGPRSIHKEFVMREIRDEDMEELSGLVKKLAFAEKYWSISGETLAKALNTIISSDPVPKDWPMYLDPLLVGTFGWFSWHMF
jgi:hypothetical protein